MSNPSHNQQSTWQMLNGLSNRPESQSAEHAKMKSDFEKLSDLFVAVLDNEAGLKLLDHLEKSTIQRSSFNIDDETIEKVALRGAFRAGQNSVVMQIIDVLNYGKNRKKIERDAEQE